ncbi:MAG: glycosyltransferase, partial [Pseudomonadota bacterium]
MRAKPQSVMRDRRWLVLTGPNCPDDAFHTLSALGQEHAIRVERFVPDLNRVLQTADISIQQVGYNTVADLLTTSCRAVFVPFAEHGQSEQPARALALEAAGRGVVVDVASADAAPTPEAMAHAIARAAALPRPTPRTDLNGAGRSVDIMEQLAATHREKLRAG